MIRQISALSERGLGWVITTAVTIFMVGMAWGFLQSSVNQVQLKQSTEDGRLAHIEQYLEKSSRGQFTTLSPSLNYGDPPADPLEKNGNGPSEAANR